MVTNCQVLFLDCRITRNRETIVQIANQQSSYSSWCHSNRCISNSKCERLRSNPGWRWKKKSEKIEVFWIVHIVGDASALPSGVLCGLVPKHPERHHGKWAALFQNVLLCKWQDGVSKHNHTCAPRLLTLSVYQIRGIIRYLLQFWSSFRNDAHARYLNIPRAPTTARFRLNINIANLVMTESTISKQENISSKRKALIIAIRYQNVDGVGVLQSAHGDGLAFRKLLIGKYIHIRIFLNGFWSSEW